AHETPKLLGGDLGALCASPERSSRVGEAGPPVLAAAFRRPVEDAPHRPHEVDMAHFLSRFRLGEPQLAAPEVMDLPSATHKHVRERKLLPVVGLGTVVAVETVAC